MHPDPTSHASQFTAGAPARPVRVRTADGVALSGVHRPGPADGEVALVVGHGFTHHTRHPATRRVVAAFSRRAAVVALDWRGHGRSAGRSTVGDRELLDLDAAVGWARRAGYERVATVGFSLGAAVALRHGALGEEPTDAVVAVSGPARWYSRESVPMRRLHWLLEQPHGRATARLLGVRLAGPWTEVPPSPVEVVSGVAPRPLLLVHFDADPYFSAAHQQALARAAGGHAELWVEPGTGHGETGTDVALADRLAVWAVAAARLRRQPVPAHDDPHPRSTVGPVDPADRRAPGSPRPDRAQQDRPRQIWEVG